MKIFFFIILTNLFLNFLKSILKQNEENYFALNEYGKILLNEEKKEESIKVFLRVIIAHPENEVAREGLADSLKKEENINFLISTLTESPSASSVLAFLAQIVKDFGAIEASLRFYKKSLELEKGNCSYLLNYVHTLELCKQYKEGVQEIQKFLTSFPNLSVGNLTCGHILNIIQNVKDVYDLEAIQKMKFEELPVISSGDITQQYNSNELDLLAVFFTLIKIFYVVGALELITPLSKLIGKPTIFLKNLLNFKMVFFFFFSFKEPVRDKRDLHLTTVRNEHAYYCCIIQLMDYHSLPLPKHKPIYVAGDSHSMSLAWQTIQVKDTSRIIHPMLVTGLKIWHLRPNSKFYPKFNFKNVIKTSKKIKETNFFFKILIQFF